MKPLHYTVHVLQRMEQRSIDRRQIEVTIREPHRRMPTLNRDRTRVMRTFGTKTLDVIYEERERYVVVVTAMWLRSEDRKAKPE